MPSVAKTISENFERFGVEDLVVTLSAKPRHARDPISLDTPIRLTEVLAAGTGLFGAGRGDFFCVDLDVMHRGRWIGWIDTDTRFHYSKAPDLATHLAYAIATDGGRHQVLSSFSPIGSAKQLQHTLAPLDTGDRSDYQLLKRCHKQFTRVLARQFVYKKTTRFCDGHNGFVGSSWLIATRDRFGESIKAPIYYD